MKVPNGQRIVRMQLRHVEQANMTEQENKQIVDSTAEALPSYAAGVRSAIAEEARGAKCIYRAQSMMVNTLHEAHREDMISLADKTSEIADSIATRVYGARPSKPEKGTPFSLEYHRKQRAWDNQKSSIARGVENFRALHNAMAVLAVKPAFDNETKLYSVSPLYFAPKGTVASGKLDVVPIDNLPGAFVMKAKGRAGDVIYSYNARWTDLVAHWGDEAASKGKSPTNIIAAFQKVAMAFLVNPSKVTEGTLKAMATCIAVLSQRVAEVQKVRAAAAKAKADKEAAAA